MEIFLPDNHPHPWERLKPEYPDEDTPHRHVSSIGVPPSGHYYGTTSGFLLAYCHIMPNGNIHFVHFSKKARVVTWHIHTPTLYSCCSYCRRRIINLSFRLAFFFCFLARFVCKTGSKWRASYELLTTEIGLMWIRRVFGSGSSLDECVYCRRFMTFIKICVWRYYHRKTGNHTSTSDAEVWEELKRT